jgi:TatD DNase family protein
MNLIDVHCHLNHDLFKKDLDKVIERAKKVGVTSIVVSGVNPPANKEVLELAKKYPIIKASLGIYPIDALGLAKGETGLPRHTEKIDLDSEFKFIEENIDQVISIGEVGMDFHWVSKEDTYDQQAKNFRKIIKFTKKNKKPIVIHSRKAEEECLEILEEEIKDEIPVVQHCFSGRKSLMTKGVELGHYFSIPPCIVKSFNFQTLVKKVPLSQLLTETDSPWLSPFKDKKNEPAYVLESIKKIAEIKELSVKEVADQIWENYVKVFGK